jgi:Tfp pilus assembly protein PilF
LFLYVTLLALFLLLWTAPVAAQGGGQGGSTLRGQVFAPDGMPMKAEVRIQVISPEENFQRYYFSDSAGRIILNNLRSGKTYRLIIEGDGKTHNGAQESFNLETVQYLNVFLRTRDDSGKKEGPPPTQTTVSTQQIKRSVAPQVARNYNEAMRLVRDNQLAPAARLLEQAIERDRRFFEAYNDLGVVYMKMNRLKDAEEKLRKAIELDPNNANACLNLGMVLIRQERFADAVTPLESSLKLKPGFTDTQLYLGEALLDVGRLNEAEQNLQAAYDANDSNRPTAMIKLAIVKVQKNDTAAAIQLLEKYLADYPKAGNRDQIESILKELRPR